MKLIIDIPKEDYNHAKQQVADGIINPLKIFIASGIPIPDNATNGEIVQMMFPYYSYERNDYVQSTEDYIIDSMECMEHDLYFGFDWWNAPYQKGGKDEQM